MADSDYIIYVDESGDHSLSSIDRNYPIFVVAFSVIEKSVYSRLIAQLLQLKFDTFGHDMVVFHEREIRKRINEFAFIRHPQSGPKFLNDLNAFVRDAPFTAIAAVIRKQALINQYKNPDNPYEVALRFCLERAYGFLKDEGQETRRTFVIAESRGSKEDRALELSFRRTCAGANSWSCTFPFEIRFAHKQSNSTGMQLADLIARPIGQEILNPGSQARIYPIIQSKFRKSPNGQIEGWGLKVFP
ncbi:MAG TPA: DUF3800 domain-containing protein [Candidatus Binataceae bacterium]|nr:DUF3800 domain-containing protein [Candidatus Binataceae bacterium]